MPTSTYHKRRGQLLTYFDETAFAAWERLTSEAPLGRVRQSVRAGRDRMRQTLLQWLPDDLGGKRLLDAGCGTGALSVAVAERGAEVIAVDLSPALVKLAQQRAAANPGSGSIEFMAGDMLELDCGKVDFVLAMDSLIHYSVADTVATLAALAGRTEAALLFTFAPATPALRLMHALGRLFPAANRAPAIEPVAEADLRFRLGAAAGLADWKLARSCRIASGFYTSQAMEVVRR